MIGRNNYRVGRLFEMHVFIPDYNWDDLNAGFNTSEAIANQQNASRLFFPVPQVTDTTEIDNSYCFEVKWPFGEKPAWVQK